MITYRKLKETELEQWFIHCMQVFSKKDYDEGFLAYFKRHWHNDPWKDLQGIFVAVDGTKIVSTIRVFHREIYFNGKVIKMGGIGEVSTNKEYRGQGLSTKLLEMAIDYMKDKNINVSLLFTGEDKITFYNRLGYQNTKRKFALSKVKQNDNKAFTVCKIDVEKDLKRISEIYDHYSGKLTGTILRNEFYWKHWSKEECKNLYGIKDDNGQLIAYIDFDLQDDVISVREFGSIQEDVTLNEVVSCTNDKVGKIRHPLILDEKNADEVFIYNGTMIQLITPFKINDITIDSNDKLIDYFDNYVFWVNDGY